MPLAYTMLLFFLSKCSDVDLVLSCTLVWARLHVGSGHEISACNINQRKHMERPHGYVHGKGPHIVYDIRPALTQL